MRSGIVFVAVLLAVVGSEQVGAERYVKQHQLDDRHVSMVAEGESEPRSIGSYTVRIYEVLNPASPTDFFVCGVVRPRDGVLEDVLVEDLDGDGDEDLIVSIRNVGTGSFLSADAFGYSDRSLFLLASVAGLTRDADPVAALRSRLKEEGAVYEEKSLWSFEARDTEGWRADGGATISVEDAHASEGDRALRVTFPGSQARIAVDGSMDLSGWEKLKFDVYNAGEPFIVTLMARDADGHTYTSWYQRVARGWNALEYSLRGFASRVPEQGKIEALDLTRIALLDLRVDMEMAQPADVYVDRIRVARGREPFTPLKEPAVGDRPVEEVPGNLLANGDFELGLQGWGSWGEWDGGRYAFGTGTGEDVYSGTASAEILCEQVGRGGIWARLEIPEAGPYRVKWAVRGRNGADRMRAVLEPSERGFVEEISVGEDWTLHERVFDAQPGRYSLYLHHVSAGVLYIDAVSVGPVDGGSGSDLSLPEKGAPTRVVVQGDRLSVDDRPFFPIGIYGVRDVAEDLAGTGFNTAIGNAVDAASPGWYARCRAAGVMTVANLTGLLRGHLPERAPAVARQLKNRPALLCYYLCDEPDHARWNVPPAEVRRAHRLLAAEDPAHPSLVLVMAWHRSMAYQYADAADIIVSDPYSVDDMDKPVRSTLWMEDARVEKQPVWVVLQVGWDQTPPLADEAMVCQAYSSIASGADGLFWFERGWCREHLQQWNLMARLSRELREIHDALCWDEPNEMQPTFSDDRVIGVLKRDRERVLLIAVNKTLEMVGNVEIAAPELGDARGVELFGGGEVSLSDGRFWAEFAPGQRHVYEVNAECGMRNAD